MAISVNEWLAGERDYNTGVQILRDQQGDSFLVNMLSSGPDAYNSQKLLQELESIQVDVPAGTHFTDAGDQLILEAFERVTTQVNQPPAAPPVYKPDHNLEKKLRYDAEIKRLWQEMAHLHGKLDALPEGPELHDVARQLMLKNLKRQDLWDQLHYYNQHGHWFDDQPENQPKPENLEQEIKNLMGNRSKARKELTKPQPAGKKKFYEDKVAELTKQIDALKAKRNA